MTWFHNLSPRERLLVLIGGGLFVVFAVWQFGINPVLKGKAEAESRIVAAQRDLSIVTQGLSRLTPSSNTGPQDDFDGPRLVAVAQAEGLIISRTQPDRTDGLTLWFENANSVNVYKFLEMATEKYKVEIRRVQINRATLGKVDAQITLGPI